jgi:serine/threonine-protein kinase
VISKGILMALSQVADAKLVHRDLKPENVMVSPSGRGVFLDFGIARHLTLPSLTQDTAVLGPLTPGYGAPEQIQNQKRAISPRTDLFAWAVVVYEMVSGRNPFTHGCRDPQEALVKTLNYEVPDLTGCDPRLSDAVRVCIRKAAHRRPSHPSVVLDMLEVQQ